MRVLVPLLLLTVPLVPHVAAVDERPDWWLSVEATNLNPGVPTRISLWLVNQGDTALPLVEIDLLVDGVFLERVEAGPIDPSTDITVRSTASFVPNGRHVMTAIVDPESKIDERDESNNVFTRARIFTLERPDLVPRMRSIEVEDWPLPRVEFEYELCNLGVVANLPPSELKLSTREPGASGYTRLSTIEPGVIAPDTCEIFTEIREYRHGVSTLGRVRPAYGHFEYWLEVYSGASELPQSDWWNDREFGSFHVGPRII